MTIRVENPKSLIEYINIIETVRKNAGHTLWFRGCTRSNYPLKPSLYRHKKKRTIKNLVELEYKILTRFKQRSLPFHSNPLRDDWETLFFMQHYGIPTRLLDWTENPFIALYFAVMNLEYESENNTIHYKYPASVWILDPIIWSLHALDKRGYEPEIMSTDIPEINRYAPQRTFTSMPEKPIALYGAHNSQRIVSQRGVFVIFGQDISSMQNQYTKYNFPTDCLIKLFIERPLLSIMRESVLQSGITESVVFPDLEGLSQELRRTFGFEDLQNA